VYNLIADIFKEARHDIGFFICIFTLSDSRHIICSWRINGVPTLKIHAKTGNNPPKKSTIAKQKKVETKLIENNELTEKTKAKVLSRLPR
jgi:hypothetical protein